MTIEARRHGSVQVVTIRGSEPFREPIRSLLDTGETLVVVDLTRKPDLDSIALGHLVACREHARAQGGLIKLVVTPVQRGIVVAACLDYLFETYRDADEALDSFQPSDVTAGIP